MAEINAAKEDEEEMTDRAMAFSSTAEREARYKETEAKFGRCKYCNVYHTYERTVGGETMTWPSCRLSSCPEFVKLSAVEKGKTVEKLKACPKCLAWNHVKRF